MDNVKRLPITLTVKEYLINFSYYKRNDKYTKSSMTVKHINKQLAQEYFKAWAKKQRTMSNVYILDVVLLNDNIKSVDL